jgi:hypothetical protein
MTFMDNFEISHTMENIDVTAYGDDSRVRINTFTEWSVTCGGTLDRSDAQQAALLAQFEGGTLSTVVLNLLTSTSTYWYGSAVLSGGSIRSQVADRVSVEFSFNSSGTLYYEDGA